MQKLVIAFIANGKSTNRYHLPFVLQRKDKIKVKKIYARNLDKHEWQRIDGITYTDNIHDLYDDPEINTIVISTPASSHYSYVKEVLNAGKTAFVKNHSWKQCRKQKNVLPLQDKKV